MSAINLICFFYFFYIMVFFPKEGEKEGGLRGVLDMSVN